MIKFFDLWWKAVGRRQGASVALLAGLVAFVWLMAGDAMSIASLPSASRVEAANLLLVIAVGVVALVPVIWRGPRVSGARRFDLLPLPPIRRSVLRLVVDGPGAMLGGLAAAVIIGAAMAAWLGDTPLMLAAHLAAVLALFVGAVLVSDILSNHVGARYPNLVYWPALAVGLLSIQGLAGFRFIVGAPRAAPLPPLPILGPFELRPNAAAGTAYVPVAACVLIAAGLVWIEFRVPAVPAPSGRPSVRAHAVSISRRLIHGAAGRATPLTPLQVKERAYVFRPAISRNAAVVSLFVILAAFALRQPAVHVAAFGFWMLFTQNLFAYDLPLAGVRRYRLTPLATSDMVHVRERVMWAVVALPVAVLSVPALAFVPLRRWLLLWAALIFGSGVFFACAIVGRLTSERFPRAVHRSTIIVQGGTVAPVGFVLIGVVTAFAGFMIILEFTVLQHWAVSRLPAIGIALGVLGSLLIAAYAAVARWETSRRRLLFETPATNSA